jgi:hypothetical protein
VGQASACLVGRPKSERGNIHKNASPEGWKPASLRTEVSACKDCSVRLHDEILKMAKSKFSLKGSHYEIPVVGYTVTACVYDGFIGFRFRNADISVLKIHGEFSLSQFGRKQRYSAGDRSAWAATLELFGMNVQEAKADRSGNLYLTFSNGVEIIVEDGPYENWHYTRTDHQKPQESLHVHGGAGQTVF